MFNSQSFCLLSLWMISGTSYATEEKTIYGVDDRVEIYQSAKKIQQLASAVVALIEKKNLIFNHTTQQYQLTEVSRLAKWNWCNNEKFSQQPSVAQCSGMLVAKDLVMTADHCVKDVKSGGKPAYDEYYVVFGYQMNKNNQWKTHYLKQDVYQIKEIVVSNGNVQYRRDEALVRLQRAVADHHQPLSLLNIRKHNVGTTLTLIGYPLGLPQKVVANGYILHQYADGSYVSNVDAFHGNSGSPVFVTMA